MRYGLLLPLSAFLFSCASDDAFSGSHAQESDAYFVAGQETLAARKAVKLNKGKAKNVILFVADGMDPTTVAAARIYDGQTRGEEGEENFLSFERFPHIAMAKTYTTSAQTPDSAGTMSAMATGIKTKSGMLSVTDAAEAGNCASSIDARTATFTELAEMAGLATGVVSTARLTHATPAATYAHSPDRGWENDGELTDEAREAGCRDIARQLIEFSYGDGIEVAMGGGRGGFLPAENADPEDADKMGRRQDGRDLTAEWKAKSNNHQFVWNKEGFDAIDPASNPRVLGLFERSHMKYEADRDADAGGEPSLAEMTAKTIEILSHHENGYMLLVEAGRVDHAHHAGNAARALRDAQAFSKAIEVALEMTGDDTLIIATADHGHTMAFQGYPAKGNDILGLTTVSYEGQEEKDGLSLAADGKPYTTLVYANGPGSIFFNSDRKDKNSRPAIHADEVTDISYRQQSLIPSRSETHGGQDVTIYATGPKAYLFGGVVEQNYIFHVIDDALSLRKKAAKAEASEDK